MKDILQKGPLENNRISNKIRFESNDEKETKFWLPLY